jgi:hypothetical protein
MAEFCKQCCIAMNIEEEHMPHWLLYGGEEPCGPGEGYPGICERCGPTYVNEHGVCIFHDVEDHEKECEKMGY